MTRIFGILIAVLFLSVGQTASAQDSELLKKAQDGDAEAQFSLGAATTMAKVLSKITLKRSSGFA